ncbi:MAG: hypothetical protein MHM6MM_004797 [Cercozoa sp. M6MM]
MVWSTTMQEFDVPLLSPSASTTVLSDRKVYPNFNRIIASNTHQAGTIGALMRSLNWEFLYIVRDQETYSSDLFEAVFQESDRLFFTVNS